MGISSASVFAAFHANGRTPIGAKYGVKRSGGIGVKLAEPPAGFSDDDYAASANVNGIIGTVRDKRSGRFANALVADGVRAEYIVRGIMANDDALLTPPDANPPAADAPPADDNAPIVNADPANPPADTDPAPAEMTGTDPVNPRANGRKRVRS